MRPFMAYVNMELKTSMDITGSSRSMAAILALMTGEQRSLNDDCT